ncbi:NTP transferase domain-containing protein [Sandarakinorhabdus sp.]|uniref:NTP transferase domain-containing protein n=1 Tax=Sandarakinorhabdus sp. TaxID=1916663 RepID=UPI00286EA32B|nr:NTP transferase domain-containing protein [Sandarakinorhabdus sp.]
MKFGPLPVSSAAGHLLAHGLTIAGQRWAKGHLLSEDDCRRLAGAGLAEIFVAQLAPGDVPEDVAASRLAGVLAGDGLIVLPAAHGRANLAARADGVLRLDPAMVGDVNAVDEALTLATLADGARVARGEIVATVKTIRYAVGADSFAAAMMAAAPIDVAAFVSRRIAIIATTLPGTSDKGLAKTARVTRARVQALGCDWQELPPCAHEAGALAAAIAAADADIILIAGASATVDRDDVIPAAIVQSGGHVERLGMPVDPGNLLCLGYVDGRAVIGLPGCARSPKRNGFDSVLEQLVAGRRVLGADIAAMGVGGLLPEAERPQPRAGAIAGPVGAVVLAAGRSSRMAGPHKLLAVWQGKPLVAHVVDAIMAAGLPPPVVVLGARGDDVREALAGREAHFVSAPDWEDGLGRSLAAGIGAVPGDWAAALVCLADMPRIEPELIAAMAAAPGDVAVPVWQGRRGHPVRWSRAHFPALRALAGDAGGKALLAGLELTEVPAPSDAILDDIDTPEALAALQLRR